MLEKLRTIVQDFNHAASFEEGLSVIIKGVRDALHVEVVSIYLRDAPSDGYRLVATDGLNPELIGHVTLGTEESLVSLVGERAEPINLEDATRHPRYRYVENLNEERFHAFLGVPIIHQRRVYGVLVVQQEEQRRFDENEEAFLVTLSAQLAPVIAHDQAMGGMGRPTDRTAVRPDTHLRGVAGAPGIAIGKAVVRSPAVRLDSVQDRTVDDVQTELLTFDRAIHGVRRDIARLRRQLADSLPNEELALFDVYAMMLEDNALAGEIRAEIRRGHWAQGAVRRVIEAHVRNFEQMEDSYLSERATDVRELGQRVLARLQQVGERKQDVPDQAVLVAEEVTPAMLDELPLDKLVGIVSQRGSGNSHLAILARALDIPTVMGAVDMPLVNIDGALLVVDGTGGEVIVLPSRPVLRHYRALQADEAEFAAELGELRDLPCITPDEHRIPLWVNVGLLADVERGLERGAEGIGLYRTEIPFMSKDRFPTEEEQRAMYREHLEKFSPRPVTMRTLDIGGDKALSYFPIEEDNPFLGWRGIRVTLDHPEILLVQVRAMLKANAGLAGGLRIMLPMITDVAEVDEAFALVERGYEEIVEEGYAVARPLVGVMVEVPAAVHQARELARRAAFLAVGSNDLTQYMLAVDRNNPRVAHLYSDLHPAVLTAIKHVVDEGHRENCTVGICGELAGNPLGAVILTGMGYDILSMNATNLPRVKWVLRSIPLTRARELAAEALTMNTAQEVQAYLEAALVDAGLGRIIGKRDD